MNRIGIFLDRDGTVNEEIDFLRSPGELRLIPGSADAIRQANGLGWKVFIITNQSGIARGYLTEEQLAGIHRALTGELEKASARIDAIYYCPHHPDFGEPPYRRECDCRKPGTGLLTLAAKEFGVDISKSFVIGDRMIDVQTGINSGATPVLVLTGYGKQELALCREHDVPVQIVAENLLEAVQYIKRVVHEEQTSAHERS
jgi:D-glycero-D-manno-heptose 1,7-bisphosphate phosphatase